MMLTRSKLASYSTYRTIGILPTFAKANIKLNPIILKKSYSENKAESRSSSGENSKHYPDWQDKSYWKDEYWSSRGGPWNQWNWGNKRGSWGVEHPWGRYDRSKRRFRCGRFGFFIFTLIGGFFVYKFFTSDDFSRREWERNQRFYNSHNYSMMAADIQSLGIVRSLKDNSQYKETKTFDTLMITPTTNSTSDDSIILPIVPVEFENNNKLERISVIALPRNLASTRFGSCRKDYGKRIIMLIDEYMKKNASQFLNAPDSEIFTEGLEFDFKTWPKLRDNIILRTKIDPNMSNLKRVVLSTDIMTIDGKVIIHTLGTFTSDSSVIPPLSASPYKFNKWFWSN